MADVEVRWVEDNHTFAAFAGDARAGFLVDHVRQGRHVLAYTEVAEGFGGQGIASRLITAALDTARDAGETVVPLCPYVAKWLARHPEHAELLDPQWTEQLGG